MTIPLYVTGRYTACTFNPAVISIVRDMISDHHHTQPIVDYLATQVDQPVSRRIVQTIRRTRHIPVPPPMDIDEIAVERLMHGDQTIPHHLLVPRQSGRILNPDVIEAIRRLAKQGLNDPEISARMRGRFTQAAILQIRRRNNIPSGYRIAAGAA